MARSEARLQFGMWRAGLEGLGPHAKLVYCVLLTEPTINHCGVGAIRIGRWAKDASLTVEETNKALNELADGAFVLLDDDTDEVFVRTLIRNDGVAAQPYVLKGALREATRVASKAIRRSLAAELRKLPARQPDGVSKSGRKVIYPDPHTTADEIDPGPQPQPPKPSREAPETLFGENPSETLLSGSNAKGSESLRGGGGGGGTSSSVATPVTNNGVRDLAIAEQPSHNKIAQALARGYGDRVPLSSFVAVMKIAKKALDVGYTEDRIRAALGALADAHRSVTSDSLRIELDGPPLRSASSPAAHVPAAYGWQALKSTGTDDRPLRALPGSEPTC